MYVYDEANDDWLYDDGGAKVYKDGTGVHDDGLDYGDTAMTGSTYAAPALNGVTSSDWSSYAVANGWPAVDLSYFFDGSLTDYANDVDTKFYSSEIEKVTGKDLDGNEETVYVGRQFLAQYPTEDALSKGTVLDQIPSLAVMEDYGTTNNTYVLRMWENVKSSGGLATWVLVGVRPLFLLQETGRQALAEMTPRSRSQEISGALSSKEGAFRCWNAPAE